jgi:hypothetical protein
MKMRNKLFRKIFILFLLFIITGSCYAQKLRLSGYGSYVFDGMYHIYYPDGDFYKGIINQGLQLGIGGEYLVTSNYGVEFNYLKRNTAIFPEDAEHPNRRNNDLRLDYVLVGINAYPQGSSGRLQGYGGMSTGVVIQTSINIMNIPDHPEKNVITKFAWAARLGGICWFSEQVGLKLQAQWLSALQIEHAVVNFDVHRLNGVLAQSSIANQLELGSGFIIKIGKEADKD